MFIKEITLENFQNLMTGIGKRKLHIDFTKQKNPVCIIIGPNGAGKTSLLSYLTPFASVGDLDIRNSSKPIIPHKNGYKKIVLIDDEMNEFVIEHFYTPKSSDDSFLVKSYFKMNDMEMNPNGNIRSFLDLVWEYLDIEPGYLKLIRIGDNVKNLIQAKSSERKQFSAKLLEEVDWYLHKYKEITQEERNLKAVINHIISEISRTGITDTDVTKAEIKSFKDSLKKIDKQLLKVQNEFANIEFELNQLSDKDQLEFEFKSAEKKLNVFKASLISARSRHLDNVAMANDELLVHEKNVAKLTADLENCKKSIEGLLKDIDLEMNELDSIKDQIKKEESNINLSSMEEYYAKIVKKKVDSYKPLFDSCSFAFSKDEYEEFMVFLKNIQALLNVTYEFGKEPIRKVLKSMLKDEDIPSIITSSLITIEAQENAERLSIIDRMVNRYSGIKIDCKEDCILKQLYSELMDIKDAVPVSDVKYTSEFYQMMKLAYENLTSIFSQINERKDFIAKLPDDIKSFFVIGNMYKKIGDGECIYDDKILNDYLSLLTELDNYKKLEKECDDTAQEIKRLKSISRIDFLRGQEDRIVKKLASINDKLDQEKENKESIIRNLANEDDEVELLRNIVGALTSYEETKKTLDELTIARKRYSELMDRQNEVKKEISKWKREKEDTTETIFRKESNLQKYKDYINELEEKQSLEEEYKNLKFALSGTTGIPLEHIRLYFKEVTKVANDLLDIVYGGSLYLDKFVITETDFLMPYVKDGIKIEDVSCASQGEVSFFNMAISSALRAISMSRYNVGLYDEVDSQFDDKNRQKFIPVLEKQLELNNIKQAFVITHNLMFRQYPVDIINMGDLDNSTIDIDYE